MKLLSLEEHQDVYFRGAADATLMMLRLMQRVGIDLGPKGESLSELLSLLMVGQDKLVHDGEFPHDELMRIQTSHWQIAKIVFTLHFGPAEYERRFPDDL